MTKKEFALIASVFLFLGGLLFFSLRSLHQEEQVFSSVDFSFYSLTGHATTSIGNYSWVAVATSTSNLGFISLCDTADTGVNNNNPIFIGFGATSTRPWGYRLPSGGCYTMSLAQNNIFYGTIYAIASTATSTLLQLYK